MTRVLSLSLSPFDQFEILYAAGDLILLLVYQTHPVSERETDHQDSSEIYTGKSIKPGVFLPLLSSAQQESLKWLYVVPININGGGFTLVPINREEPTEKNCLRVFFHQARNSVALVVHYFINTQQKSTIEGSTSFSFYPGLRRYFSRKPPTSRSGDTTVGVSRTDQNFGETPNSQLQVQNVVLLRPAKLQNP